MTAPPGGAARWALLALLMAGCSGDPPHPLEGALSEYDRGQTLLEAGQPGPAAEAFAAASAAHPEAAELHLWRGRALAAAGDLPGAIAAASQALELRGTWGIAHYNRACWRARSGELELAAMDLQVALETGEIDPADAASDADLDPLRADERFRGQVPSPSLPASVAASADPLFLGSEWSVTIAASAESPEIEMSGALPPTMRHLRTVEDRRGDERTVEAIFRVEGAGEGSLGPWTVSAGGLTAQVGPAPWRFLAPPDHEPPEAAPPAQPFALPSAILAAAERPGAARVGDRVIVRADPGDRIDASPELPSIRYDVRREGQPLEQGLAFQAPDQPVQITVLRGGQTVFEGAL